MFIKETVFANVRYEYSKKDQVLTITNNGDIYELKVSPHVLKSMANTLLSDLED